MGKLKENLKDSLDMAKYMHEDDQSYLDRLTVEQSNNINALSITMNQALIMGLFGLVLEFKFLVWFGMAGAVFQVWKISKYLGRIKSERLK